MTLMCWAQTAAMARCKGTGTGYRTQGIVMPSKAALCQKQKVSLGCVHLCTLVLCPRFHLGLALLSPQPTLTQATPDACMTWVQPSCMSACLHPARRYNLEVWPFALKRQKSRVNLHHQACNWHSIHSLRPHCLMHIQFSKPQAPGDENAYFWGVKAISLTPVPRHDDPLTCPCHT